MDTKMFAVLASVLVLISCGGGGGGNSQPAEPPPQTINTNDYLAQSKNPDGNTSTPLSAGDAWTYERFDFGHYQGTSTFLNLNGSETIWSQTPFGRFVAANGDGGETYGNIGGAIYATSTQDGSKPGVTQFGTSWWLFDGSIPSCDQGWRYSPDNFSRACHTNVSYPETGINSIAVDTVVSEHIDMNQNGWSPPNGNMGAWNQVVERFYFGQGWGRLVWQAWGSACPSGTPVPDLPARNPALSFDPPPYQGMTKCDGRIYTNIMLPAVGGLSGSAFGWP